MKKTIFVFCLLVFSILLCDKTVLAQSVSSDTSVVIQPSKIEATAAPGQKVTRSFSVINRSNYFVSLKLVVKDYRQASADGKLEFYDAKTEQASSWIVPQFLQIGLKPLETKDVGVVLNVPKDFSAGGHYGAILFQPAGDSTNLNTYNFGELFLLTVAGNNKTTAIGKTVNFSTTGIQQGNPVDFSFTMQNTGNTHFETSGKLVLSDWTGKQIGSYDLGQLTIYPGTSRVYSWRWSNTPFMGIYKADVMLSDPSSNQRLKYVDGAWFFIFPWEIALIVLAVVALVFAAVLVKKRSYVSRQINIRDLNKGTGLSS